MKKQVLLFSLLCGVTSFVCAQLPVEKGLNTISRSSAEATIGFLASDELQGLSQRTSEERAFRSASGLYCEIETGSSSKTVHEKCTGNDSR